MKKWTNKVFVLLICLLCVGCTQSTERKKPSFLDEWMTPSKKIKVLSTTAIIDNLVGEIGEQHISHMALIKGQLDPHSYELVKGDNEKIACADLIFYNGLELEHGASLKHQLGAHTNAYSLGESLVKRAKESLICSEAQIDPHIWMDIRLFSQVIDPIVQHLSECDPEHAELFKHNGERLRKKMLELDADIYRRMQSIPIQHRYLITSHDAFFYFARRYLADETEVQERHWRERFTAPEGLAPDGQISPKDIQAIIEYAADHGVKAIFSESNLNQDALKKIVSILNAKGLQVRLATQSLYGDAMGDSGSTGSSYLNMMKHNALVIETWLKGEENG